MAPSSLVEPCDQSFIMDNWEFFQEICFLSTYAVSQLASMATGSAATLRRAQGPYAALQHTAAQC